MFFFDKKKYKTKPKYCIVLLQGRHCGWSGHSGCIAGISSAPQFLPLVTTGDPFLTMGSFHHQPTHQCISLSSQPGLPGCNCKEQCCLMSLSVAAHSDVSRIRGASLFLISGRSHREDDPHKHVGKSTYRALCGTRRRISPKAEAPQTCEGSPGP